MRNTFTRKRVTFPHTKHLRVSVSYRVRNSAETVRVTFNFLLTCTVTTPLKVRPADRPIDFIPLPSRKPSDTWFYPIIFKYVEGRESSDLAFTTSGGGKISHTRIVLEQLSAAFGKRFSITPTENRKAIPEAEVRKAAKYMTHSVETARRAYVPA